jgi:hypothetical protein
MLELKNYRYYRNGRRFNQVFKNFPWDLHAAVGKKVRVFGNFRHISMQREPRGVQKYYANF